MLEVNDATGLNHEIARGVISEFESVDSLNVSPRVLTFAFVLAARLRRRRSHRAPPARVFVCARFRRIVRVVISIRWRRRVVVVVIAVVIVVDASVRPVGRRSLHLAPADTARSIACEGAA